MKSTGGSDDKIIYSPSFNPLYPFSQTLSLIISVGVILLNTFLIIIFIQNNYLKKQNHAFYLIISLGQSTISLVIVFNQCYSIITNQVIQGIVCKLSGVIFHLALYITIISTILLAISKYFAVTRMIKQSPPLQGWVWPTLFSILAVLSLIDSTFIAVNDGYELMPSSIYCHVVKKEERYTDSILTVAILLGGMVIVFTYYCALIFLVQRRRKDTQKLDSSIQQPLYSSFEQNIHLQTLAINQSLLFMLGFYFFYFPEIVILILGLFKNTTYFKILDSLSILFINMHGLLNPFVLLLFHPTIHPCFLKVLGIPDMIHSNVQLTVMPSSPNLKLVEVKHNDIREQYRPFSDSFLIEKFHPEVIEGLSNMDT